MFTCLGGRYPLSSTLFSFVNQGECRFRTRFPRSWVMLKVVIVFISWGIVVSSRIQVETSHTHKSHPKPAFNSTGSGKASVIITTSFFLQMVIICIFFWSLIIIDHRVLPLLHWQPYCKFRSFRWIPSCGSRDGMQLHLMNFRKRWGSLCTNTGREDGSQMEIT